MKKSIADNIHDQIAKHKLSMRPKWYYTLGAVGVGVGLTILTLLAIFFIAIAIFRIRVHAPFAFLSAGQSGFSPFLATLPWIPMLIAIIAIAGGLFLMKKYEFSYKHAFWGIASGFFVTIIGVGIIVDATDLSSRAHDVKEFRPFFSEHYANESWVMGSVEEINIPQILLLTPTGEKYIIFVNEDTLIKPPTTIHIHEWIRVVGEQEDNDVFEADVIFHNTQPRGTKRLYNNYGYPPPPQP